MNCPHTKRTEAMLDGSLSGSDAAEAARHIETCEECQALVADRESISAAMKSEATRFEAPEQLRSQVLMALDDEADRVVPLRGGRRNFWFGAASGAGATALAASLTMLLILPPSAGTLADAVTDAHTRALTSGQIFQVASSNHHTVKPWFATHVEVSPPVADFAAQGFQLTGGRVEEIAGSRAAVVTYRHGGHEIDLFVWADRGSRLPGEEMRHGYRAVFWKSGDLNFAAVSDMEGSELKKFVNLVRAEPE
jgi:anti-sigma factor RsiW